MKLILLIVKYVVLFVYLVAFSGMVVYGALLLFHVGKTLVAFPILAAFAVALYFGACIAEVLVDEFHKDREKWRKQW